MKNTKYLLSTIIALTVTSLSQYSFGRVIICKCGYIKLWQGVTFSSENSQHISDWYSFSHIIHGFGFYYFGKLFLKKLSLLQVFLIALTIEAGWEILENTSFIINRYRETTISLDYYGDSILNSSFDVLFMVLGFYMAKKLPVWAIIFLTIAMELATGYIIRDNLALNILMIVRPVEAVKRWQTGI